MTAFGSDCHGVVFLIGYRGTGKSTVAALLAERLGWAWLDADAYLEAQAGCSIRAIFEKEGEAGFRVREEAALAELCRLENVVLATGGGIVIRPANRRLLKASGFVVWLTADAETIWQRLQGDAATRERRPDLTAQGGLEEIRALLAERQPWYRECAHLTVDTAGRSPEDVAEAILAAIPRAAS
jgi:shikimate kinase